MGIFDSIKNAILGHAAAPDAPRTTTTPTAPQAAPKLPDVDSRTGMLAAPAPAPDSPQAVDIEAVLGGLVRKRGAKLNWQTSIVDLMKLVDLDPSLQNREQLAQELGYSGDKSDSASMNIWLHKQVMIKLEQNGGRLPANMRG
jgi:Domain of unknown function (DUF3597)